MHVRYVVAAVAVAVAIVASAALLAPGFAGSAAPPQPVREQNTDGAGDIKVHEQGTAAVSAQQSGSWSVGISGTPTVLLDPGGNTVRVASASDSPLIVRDRDNPALQPFAKFVGAELASGSATVSSEIAAPTGKLLVGEYVSAEISVPAGQRPHLILSGQNDAPIFLPLISQGLLDNGMEDFVASDSVRLYSGAYEIRVVRAGGTDGTGNVNFTLSGYLVDTP